MSCGGKKICISNNFVEAIAGEKIAGESARLASSRLRRFLVKIFVILAEARYRQVAGKLEKIRQREILLQLDDRVLRDLGLTREQVEREGQVAFWE